MKNLLSTLFAMAAIMTMVACGGNKADTVEAKEAGEEATSTVEADNYAISSGTVYWTGSKAFVETTHNGTINVTGGQLSIADGNVVAGSFDIDMTSIVDNDLASKPDMKAKLEGHLKSDDFFGVEQFPKATFTVVRAEPIDGNPEATHNLTGNLTMRGITKEITFPVSVSTVNGKLNAVAPNFAINRVDWDVKFNNSTIVGLGKDDLINDDIQLTIQLEGVKS